MDSFSCGCGCWGFILGFGAFCLALLLGATALKSFAIAGLVLVICTFMGLILDVIGYLFSI